MLWPNLVATSLINVLLCQTEYIYNFILSLYFKHNGMFSTQKK